MSCGWLFADKGASKLVSGALPAPFSAAARTRRRRAGQAVIPVFRNHQVAGSNLWRPEFWTWQNRSRVFIFI